MLNNRLQKGCKVIKNIKNIVVLLVQRIQAVALQYNSLDQA